MSIETVHINIQLDPRSYLIKSLNGQWSHGQQRQCFRGIRLDLRLIDHVWFGGFYDRLAFSIMFVEGYSIRGWHEIFSDVACLGYVPGIALKQNTNMIIIQIVQGFNTTIELWFLFCNRSQHIAKPSDNHSRKNKQFNFLCLFNY